MFHLNVSNELKMNYHLSLIHSYLNLRIPSANWNVKYFIYIDFIFLGWIFTFQLFSYTLYSKPKLCKMYFHQVRYIAYVHL